MTECTIGPTEEVDLTSPHGIGSLLKRIDGRLIEKDLVEIARIGGVPIPMTLEQQRSYQQPERFAVNRLALSNSDTKARSEVIKPWMQEAGMKVVEHPLALIGTYEGYEPELDPVVIVSH